MISGYLKLKWKQRGNQLVILTILPSCLVNLYNDPFLASHVKSSLINEDLEQISADDLEEMDIKWQMAMLTMRIKRFIKRTGRNNFGMKKDDGPGFDKSKVRCYKCNDLGNFARECKGNTQQHNNQSKFNKSSSGSTCQALVSQEGFGFDWSDQAEETAQNQALMAEISETSSGIPAEVISKLCSKAFVDTVKKYRDHNQNMCDSIKKLEQFRRESNEVIVSLEDQIKAYQANELQFEYDQNYWKLEKKEYELKLAKYRSELEKVITELEESKADIEKFFKASKAMDEILKAQINDDLKKGIGYNNTPRPYNNNYIPPKSNLADRLDTEDLKPGVTEVDLVEGVEVEDLGEEGETRKKEKNKDIPDENHILTNEKGGRPFVKSNSVDKGKGKERNKRETHKKTTESDPSSSKQSQNKRGNQRNWNKQWFAKHKNQDEQKKANKMVQMWVPKAAVSNTTATTVSSTTASTSNTSGRVTAAKGNTYTHTPIIVTRYSSHAAPNSDHLLKSKLTKGNQGRGKNLWHVDSGCSRHMTGIMSLLENFKRFEGGHVAFGDNPKRGNVSGKCKISKGMMTFEDVYYVEQLKYNLLSVSQVYDKKSSILFNDEEYLFGPTNVMSIGKKSYCLVIVDDYSRFTWVFFLRTKDETSGLIKPFVIRVENKINLKVKVIRSDNGTEFKNADLNNFCEEKGIERQYSAPRTPQQNGVVERRNMTLIEAARTMLVDSKLPITFWAETVNTACYVQSRVLVVKSKGKTPCELFEKKKPFIGFLKPFGCPCTILNTKSHLGKFDNKSEDGFLVGYSSQNKALRVFNISSRIIEESDNVKCNENTPNILGTGPNWLFDIDSLTNSLNMSYAVDTGSSADKANETGAPFVMFPMPIVDPIEFCNIDKEPETQKEGEGDQSQKKGEGDQLQKKSETEGDQNQIHPETQQEDPVDDSHSSDLIVTNLGDSETNVIESTIQNEDHDAFESNLGWIFQRNPYILPELRRIIYPAW
ncbi:hypothetical protein OSB04_016672 [Centaurea solstitialis]|uniref:Integrase catalytic domain-containing protein n=1 Tax=Centaurea solstitialis TaxID=347529 RepID=A0AA38TJJ6_9ASTR|nr:hypothetical protein OSB04_016672 [Centaurea solstitialis]